MELLSPIRPQTASESIVDTADSVNNRVHAIYKSFSNGDNTKITIYPYCSYSICRGIQSPLSQRMALYNLHYPASYYSIFNLSSLHPPPSLKVLSLPSTSLHTPPLNPCLPLRIALHEPYLRNKLPGGISLGFPPHSLQLYLCKSLSRYPHSDGRRDITVMFSRGMDIC